MATGKNDSRHARRGGDVCTGHEPPESAFTHVLGALREAI